jgi:hypothetical protein
MRRPAAAANVRNDHPPAACSEPWRNILEVFRVAGQPVQADDRQVRFPTDGRIVARVEGQAVA